MNLKIQTVVELYEQARLPEFNYMQAGPSYGVARWIITGWDIDVKLSMFAVWGPKERWGRIWSDTLPYHRLEITHQDFCIEVEAHPQALAFYSTRPKGPSKVFRIYQNYYDLDYVGDFSVLKEVFVYHKLSMRG